MANKSPNTENKKWVKPNKVNVAGKSATLTLPPDVPVEKFAIGTQPTDSKKWCIKDTLAFQPVIEKWYSKDDVKIQIPITPPLSYPLKRNSIVDVLPQDISIPWSAIAYEKTMYEVIDEKKGKKDWVTTKFTGWVNSDHLDDYIEEFPNSEVKILHATKSTLDLEQDMTIEDEGYDEINARYNMCGELSITFIVKNDIDPTVNIDDVLKNWKGSGVKNKKGVNVNYASLVGKGTDKGLESKHLKEILDLYYSGDVKKIEPYSVGGKKIPLALSAYDDRHASKEFQGKLLEYYFIALVTINPNTGELIPNPDPLKRNHWVVVDKVTHDGVRVEIYNPSPNKRQCYSFRELFNSVGSNPNTGWWVERKQFRTKDDTDIAPKPEVSIENPTPDKKDAEQYILVENLKKVNLCGEFSVAYILKNSLDRGLENWSTYQEGLKSQGKTTAGVWELATVLQAFGINARKAGVLDGKPYSIDRILKYWKATQPDLYGSILGGSNNETTGLEDLITILKAYGYTNKDDYKYGSLPSSPGASAEMLKRYYFIAGVRIDTGKMGRLKNKLGDGVDHWVVLTEINPVGTLVGGNGGWVHLYNPFMNVMEEYSYKDFMEAYSGVGLWVTKDVAPTFTSQAHVPAKDNSKKSKGKPKVVVNRISEAAMHREIQNAKNNGTTSLGAIADMLSNPKKGFGWTRQEIFKLLKNPEVTNTHISLAEVERLLCKSLEIGSIAREISRWIRDQAGENPSFAVGLASLLRDFGVLVVEDNTSPKIVNPENPPDCNEDDDGKIIRLEDSPISINDRRGRIVTLKDLNLPKDKNLSHVLQDTLRNRFEDSTPSSQLARKVVNDFMDKAVEQLTKIPPIKVAYKNWACYVEWEKPIEASKPDIYRVRKWGDDVMGPLGFDTKKVGTGNFQAVGLYNKETGFGAVTNYIHILRDDINNLIDMQFDQIVDGKKWTVEDKMNWLCQYSERIYLFDNRKDSWQKSERIRWGTLALGGNLVQIVDEDKFPIVYPGEKKGTKATPRRMMRLAGFTKKDWSRPLDELLAEGLVHRCFVANDGNHFADTSKGIVYSPFFSVTDVWSFNSGTAKPDGLYIPFDYLEPKPKPKPHGK